MTSLFDNFMEIFYSFRLGNIPSLPNHCLYIPYHTYQEEITRSTASHSSTSLKKHQLHHPIPSSHISRHEIPPKEDGTVRIIIVSDTHMRHRALGNLPAGDIFIHAGDILMTNRMLSTTRSIEKLHEFNEWLSTIPCPTKVVICGNHDKVVEDIGLEQVSNILTNGVYLQNSSIEVNSIRIWGSPLSSGRSGNSAFQSREFAHETTSIVEDISGERIDILVTHGPNRPLAEKLQPQLLHIWGHAHGAHGVRHTRELSCPSINASIMDTRYNPSQVPIVIDIIHPKAESVETSS